MQNFPFWHITSQSKGSYIESTDSIISVDSFFWGGCMKKFMIFVAMLICFSGCDQSNGNKLHSFSVQSLDSDQKAIPVAILGGGIAGLTAALYCAQAGVEGIVIEGIKPGGALAQSHSVRNWPGVIDAPGVAITESIKKQVIENGITIVGEEVVNSDFSSWPYTITSKKIVDGGLVTRKALSCIVATGSEPRYLGIPGETGPNGYWGKGVSNCAVCEGSLCKDKAVGIVGGGDAAVVEATYLAGIAKKVTVFVRKDHFRAKDRQALDRMLAHKNIEVMFNTEVRSIQGDGEQVTQVMIEKNQSKKIQPYNLDALFLAIGATPNTALFKGKLDLDANGFITTTEHQSTKVPGVFVAGDVCDPFFIQAVTAAGQGCMAMLQAKKFLEAAGFSANKNIDVASAPTKTASVKAPTLRYAGQLKEIESTKEFKELVLHSPVPVFIDMFGTFCMPCRMMTPVLEEAAKQYSGRVQFVKIDVSTSNFAVDKVLASINAPSIKGIPAFLFVKDGKVVSMEVGRKEMSELHQLIKKHFGISR